MNMFGPTPKINNGAAVLVAAALIIAVLTACSASEEDNSKESTNIGIHAQTDDDHSEINMLLPSQEVEPLQARAKAGDIEAADRLGNHYRQLGSIPDEVRWRTLAANRGDCGSMGLLREIATNAGDRRGAAHWNRMMRTHACTWGKTYPGLPGGAPEDLPLWNNE